MEPQLIIFIDPKKFYDLLDQPTSLAINYIEEDFDDDGSPVIRFLNNSKSIVYLNDNNSKPIVSGFNPNDAENATALLIPDSLTNFQFTPRRPFKILYHSNPASKSKRDDLKRSVRFWGERESSEEPSTPYGELAKAICNCVLEKPLDARSLNNVIKSIYEETPDFDSALEEKLILLQKIAAGEAFNGDSEESLQLNEKIKEFQPAFDEFSKHYIDFFDLLKNSEGVEAEESKTAAFNVYKQAYDKFYDALEIEQ